MEKKCFAFSVHSNFFASTTIKMWTSVLLERLHAVSLHSVSTLLGVIYAFASVALLEMEKSALVS